MLLPFDFDRKTLYKSFHYTSLLSRFIVINKQHAPQLVLKVGVLSLLLAGLELIEQELARGCIAFVVFETIKEVGTIHAAGIGLLFRGWGHGGRGLFFGGSARRSSSTKQRSRNGTHGLVGNGTARSKGHTLGDGATDSR
jgi:hypothetical protein